MSALSIQPTYPIFTDIDGQPLEDGYVWIGAANLDPQTNPINVYWDAALTLPAAQPIRTLAGYPANSGTPARLYVNSDYSIRIMNRNGSAVYSAPSATERYGNVITLSDLAFLQSGIGAVDRTALSKMRDVVSVKDFGAVGDGITDDTVAIQAAIDAFSYGGGKVYLPAGTYKVTSQITISKDRLHVVGDGQGATKIVFSPSASAVCFLVDKGSSVAYQGSIKGMSFYSNDTTYTKTAIKLIDCSGYTVEDCGTLSPHWAGAGSIFLNIQGRENGWISNIYAAADKPIVVDPIPSPHTASGIGIDHHNFHNLYLIAAGSYPVVTFSSGLLLTQVSFTGAQAWVGGTHGLYWNDTTSTSSSNGLILENVRFEQTTDTNAYLVYINHNYSCQGLTIKGGQGGDRNGFYLRKVLKVAFESFYYTSTTKEAVNADTTVDDIVISNCFWQAGSTSGLTGHDLVYSAPKNPSTGAFPPSAAYCLTSNNSQMYSGRTYTITPTLNAFTQVLGGGAITPSCTYILIGKLCFFKIKIVCTGGATIASTANTSYISGLPTAADYGVCEAVRLDNTTSLGNGSVWAASGCLTPTWTAAANATYIISGSYFTT